MAKSEFPSLHLQLWVDPKRDLERPREKKRRREGGRKEERARERGSEVTTVMAK